MRIYGHIGWIDTETEAFENGRALCGKEVDRKRSAPLVTCRKCVDELVKAASPRRGIVYRKFGETAA